MQRFTTKIVNMMKAERLFESHGGPIILSQVANAISSFNFPLEFFSYFTYFYCVMHSMNGVSELREISFTIIVLTD